MECERCKSVLIGKQERWCSRYCSKLGLKSLYRKKHKDRLNKYQNNFRRKATRASGYYWVYIRPKALERDKNQCTKCGRKKDIQVHHIKSRTDGGRNSLSNLITLCRKCHYKEENKIL